MNMHKLISFVISAVLIILLVVVIYISINVDFKIGEGEEEPCEFYKYSTIQHIPVGCYEYYNLSAPVQYLPVTK